MYFADDVLVSATRSASLTASGRATIGVPLLEEVTAELASLRRSQGMSRTQLSKCTGLLSLQVVSRRAPADGSPTERISVLFELLTDQATSAGDIRTLAARNALGVGLENPGTLTERRLTFARAHSMSIDTIRRLEDAWFREVAYELLGMRHGTSGGRSTSTPALANERILLERSTASAPYRVRPIACARWTRRIASQLGAARAACSASSRSRPAGAP